MYILFGAFFALFRVKKVFRAPPAAAGPLGAVKQTKRFRPPERSRHVNDAADQM